MQHRDYITITKVLDEVKMALKILGDYTLDEFINDEVLKRAIGMTVINIGELVKNLTDDFRATYNHISL